MSKDVLASKYVNMFKDLALLIGDVDKFHSGSNEKAENDDINRVNNNQSKKKGS